jgi:hypothetical protein
MTCAVEDLTEVIGNSAILCDTTIFNGKFLLSFSPSEDDAYDSFAGSVHPFLRIYIYIYIHIDESMWFCRGRWADVGIEELQFNFLVVDDIMFPLVWRPNKQDERYLQEKTKYLRQHFTLWRCWIVEGNWTSCLFSGLPKMAMSASELLCTWTRAWNSSHSATRKPWWIGVTGFAIGAPSLWSACRGLSSVLQILHFD